MLRFSLIRLRSEHFKNCTKNVRSGRTEMAFKEGLFRIIQFPEMILLTINCSCILPNLTEIDQIVLEL